MTPLQCAVRAILVACLTPVGASRPTNASHFTIPLIQNRDPGDIAERLLHGVSRVAARSVADTLPLDVAPAYLGNGFWFGDFDVGQSQNLSLLIDTGSAGLAINPGLYLPSSESVDLNKTGYFGYDTWLRDGCGSGVLGYSSWVDRVSLLDLIVKNQTFYTVTTPPPPSNNSDIPRRLKLYHQGTMGMVSGVGDPSWFQNVCSAGEVNECRFGLAFGTGGRGKQIFGGVDESLFEGELTSLGFAPRANVVVNETKTVLVNESIAIFDCGTDVVLAPIEQARTIFDNLGIQAVEYNNLPDCHTNVLLGYYSCDNPPVVGLELLSSNGTIGNSTSPLFNIEPEALQFFDNGNNNCTASLVGYDFQGRSPGLTIGQAWFQGKYVDQDANGMNQGFANLKDKTGLGN